MSVLGNYVEFTPGVAKKLKISRYYMAVTDIKDPESKEIKPVNVLMCIVTREDDKDVNKTLSISSEKLAQMIMPGLKKDLHKEKEVRLIMSGRGYFREYSMEWV